MGFNYDLDVDPMNAYLDDLGIEELTETAQQRLIVGELKDDVTND